MTLGFPTMMATPKCRNAYFNTTQAILRGPRADTYGLVDYLDRAHIAYLLDIDDTLPEPSLLTLHDRRTFVGRHQIEEAVGALAEQ